MNELRKNVFFGCLFLIMLSPTVLTFAQEREESRIRAEDFKKRAVQYRQRGYEIQQLGDLDGAMSSFQKAVAFDPYYATAYNDIGIIYETRGLIDLAEENYLKAIDADKKYLPAYTNLAYLYEKKADVLKAAYYWMKRISLGAPGDPWTEKARENFRSLSLLSEEVRRIFIKFDAAYLSRQVINKKVSDFQESVIKAKEYFERGKLYFDQGDYTAAREAFESALFLNPNNPEIIEYYEKSKDKEIEKLITEHTSRGIRLYESGDTEAAREEFNKALTIIPTQSNQK